MERPTDAGSNRVAIITARGGSKRVPRKNIRSFDGLPIIVRVIDSALDSGLFDEVMVSTDDAEIAEVAIEAGAAVPFRRRAATADDHASSSDVLREVLAAYASRSRHFSHACCLYPTAPFITAEALRTAWQELHGGVHDTVFPIVRFPSPVQRALRKAANGRLERIQPEFELTRSQDLEPCYYDAGQFYWFEVAAFLRRRTLLSSNSAGIVVDGTSVHDIDDEEDWMVAERKFQWLKMAA